MMWICMKNGFKFINSDHYRKIFYEHKCVARHLRVILNQGKAGLIVVGHMLLCPSLILCDMKQQELFLNPAFWYVCRHFTLSNLTTVLSRSLKKSPKSHQTPFASLLSALPSLCRWEHHPDMFSMIVPQVRALIKITSGRSKLASISVPALKFQLKWCRMGMWFYFIYFPLSLMDFTAVTKSQFLWHVTPWLSHSVATSPYADNT